MSEQQQQDVYPVRDDIAARAWADSERYEAMYQRSLDDPDGFWAEQAQRLDWISQPTRIKNTSFDRHDVDIRWFEDGELNVAANCLDRHLEKRGDQTAIIWEGDDPAESRHISYRELYERTNQLANALKAQGIGKGDTVTLYMPMIPETTMAMLACARIGAVHSVIFGGFSPDAIAQRVIGAESRLVITADESVRGGKHVPLKDNVDAALTRDGTDVCESVLVVKRTGGDIDWHDSRDIDFADLVDGQSAECPAETMNAEDPLFILYTSGSTGAPKGLKHTSGGYLTYVSLAHQYVFDYRDGEVFWCTADVGWITGHSFVVYGPLVNGATTLMFEGVPNYPTAGRMGEIVDKHQVNTLYTAPTAIRALMAHGDSVMDSSSRDSLRLLGTAGEPINPEAWEWFHRVMGNERCPILDTWWQTETGAVMIAPLPGAMSLKPGSATRPFFGVRPAIMDSAGNRLEGKAEGNLVILDSWPGQARSIWGNHERFVTTYFSTYEGVYFTGDGCRRDADGDYWITGRVDDVLNVSGHRMGTAEIESSLVAHDAVAEAAVVGYPHDIKGQGIYIYVTLADTVEPGEALKKELAQRMRHDLGAIAAPDIIQWAPALPKTRSGKIMRRILRKIAANECDGLGDTSTLADPSVVDELIDQRVNR
ncbi:acetate--CoA ligase [Vreelandella jeotgali]|uniref:acetate--CoA ligase n=1 Tax=Vreelandella jeotgali TaxID=553386 RepID=UPI000344CA37|nr:acetate--CoA ligase [Halomonas jeotgali]